MKSEAGEHVEHKVREAQEHGKHKAGTALEDVGHII